MTAQFLWVALLFRGLSEVGVPRLIRPMMATLVHELPGEQDRYGWELKWDGVRAIAYVCSGDVRLLSRNDNDMTASYPELGVLARLADVPVVLDGEIIALRGGRPDFGALQARMHVRQPAQRLLTAVPVHYYVFDLLHHGGRSLLNEPYTTRRGELDGLALDQEPVRTPPWYSGSAADVRAASIEQGLEGVVGKQLTSRYRPGRHREWIKVKNVRYQEVIIAGWAPGKGTRAGMIGSLLLGIYDHQGRLRYAGAVGTGFTEAALRTLAEQLRPMHRDESPFGEPVPLPHARKSRWVTPTLVGEVAFTEWTSDNVMRHPSWRGLRPDKQANQVRREDLPQQNPRLADRAPVEIRNRPAVRLLGACGPHARLRPVHTSSHPRGHSCSPGRSRRGSAACARSSRFCHRSWTNSRGSQTANSVVVAFWRSSATISPPQCRQVDAHRAEHELGNGDLIRQFGSAFKRT